MNSTFNLENAARVIIGAIALAIPVSFEPANGRYQSLFNIIGR